MEDWDEVWALRALRLRGGRRFVCGHGRVGECANGNLKALEFHLLDTGHFALEEDGAIIAEHIRAFLAKHTGKPK